MKFLRKSSFWWSWKSFFSLGPRVWQQWYFQPSGTIPSNDSKPQQDFKVYFAIVKVQRRSIKTLQEMKLFKKLFNSFYKKLWWHLTFFFYILAETKREESTETENLQVKAKRMGKDSERWYSFTMAFIYNLHCDGQNSSWWLRRALSRDPFSKWLFFSKDLTHLHI